MTGVRPGTPPEPVGRGFLHGRDNLAATALRTLFHRVGQRRVHLAGCTPNPSPAWVIQQARQLSWTLAERSQPFRSLIRDRIRNSPTILMTCSAATGLRSFGRRLARHRPTALRDGSCARRARNVSTGYWILNQQHLDRILEVFVHHYNEHWPHRALSLAPPEARRSDASPPTLCDARILRRDRLGGVVHEYVRAA